MPQVDADGRTPEACAAAQGHADIATLLDAQRFAPRILPRVLSDEEVGALCALRGQIGPEHDDGAGHATIYLHARQVDGAGVMHDPANGVCARALQRLVAMMKSTDPRSASMPIKEPRTATDAGGGGELDGKVHAPAPAPLATELSVRCAELHTYTPGGQLMYRDHRDSGSSLTLSVLLTDPEQHEGGRFLTFDAAANRRTMWTDDDAPVVHAPTRGDAIFLRSEDLHAVTPVKSGGRQSLVIELWARPPNNVDRYK